MPNVTQTSEATCGYSVVVPMHDEAANVEPLYIQLVAALDALGESYELLFVDDGSTDATFPQLVRLAEQDTRVRVIRLKRNFGQTAALAAGFDYAEGEVILSMDADLRSSPADIPLLLKKMAEGYDLVSGYRHDRRHEGMLRTLPSTVANWMLAKLSGVPLRDFGNTFKAYRREVVQSLRLYDDHHRFIPVLASWQGARIAEVPVSDSPRKSGKSHYGLGRVLRVPFDLLTVSFMQRYRGRPMRLFGPLALMAMGLGWAILLYLLGVYLFVDTSVFSQSTGALILAVIFILSSVQALATGLVAEMLVRNHYVTQGESIYRVDQIVRAAPLSRSAH